MFRAPLTETVIPSLKHLSIINCDVPWDSPLFYDLDVLFVHSAPASPSLAKLSEITQILKKSPGLIQLRLRNVIRVDHLDDAIGMVQLDSLTLLDLDFSATIYPALIRCLRLPEGPQLQWEIQVTDVTADFDFTLVPAAIPCSDVASRTLHISQASSTLVFDTDALLIESTNPTTVHTSYLRLKLNPYFGHHWMANAGTIVRQLGWSNSRLVRVSLANSRDHEPPHFANFNSWFSLLSSLPDLVELSISPEHTNIEHSEEVITTLMKVLSCWQNDPSGSGWRKWSADLGIVASPSTVHVCPKLRELVVAAKNIEDPAPKPVSLEDEENRIWSHFMNMLRFRDDCGVRLKRARWVKAGTKPLPNLNIFETARRLVDDFEFAPFSP